MSPFVSRVSASQGGPAIDSFGIAVRGLEARAGQLRGADRRRASDPNGRLGRGEIFLLDLLDQFGPVDRHAPGRGEAQAYLIAAHAHDNDLDVVADSDPLTRSSGQYEHLQRPRPRIGCLGTSVPKPVPRMTFAQRSKGESRQKTSEYLKEDVRPTLLCWANVRSMCLVA